MLRATRASLRRLPAERARAARTALGIGFGVRSAPLVVGMLTLDQRDPSVRVTVRDLGTALRVEASGDIEYDEEEDDDYDDDGDERGGSGGDTGAAPDGADAGDACAAEAAADGGANDGALVVAAEASPRAARRRRPLRPVTSGATGGAPRRWSATMIATEGDWDLGRHVPRPRGHREYVGENSFYGEGDDEVAAVATGEGGGEGGGEGEGDDDDARLEIVVGGVAEDAERRGARSSDAQLAVVEGDYERAWVLDDDGDGLLDVGPLRDVPVATRRELAVRLARWVKPVVREAATTARGARRRSKKS